MIFGHSQTVSKEDDAAWDTSFGMSSSCTVAGGDDGDETFSLATVVDVVVDAVVVASVIVGIVIDKFVIDVADVVASSSSVRLRHDAVIINVKTSKSRNGPSILEKDMQRGNLIMSRWKHRDRSLWNVRRRKNLRFVS